MKSRLICLALVLAVLISVLPGAQATTSLCFVAMNDTIPLTLKGNGMPYYNESRLYIPFTAFNISPNGVCASYNVEQNTFVLFNANETLIFDLEAGIYTDRDGKEYEIKVAYRSGMLYVPEKVISHFNLGVTLLFSRAGYPIIRFDNGGQVYDDGMFVAQAENLINRAAQEYEAELSAQNPVPGTETEEQEEDPEEEQGPVDVYLAFKGEAVSEDVLELLDENNISAAFFLTETQILQNRELVRAIYSNGHTVGITISPDAADPEAALYAANDALDRVLFFRSVLALLPGGTVVDAESLHILEEPAMRTVEEIMASPEEPQFYVVDGGAPGVIASLVNLNASMHKLLETTF